MHCASEHLIRTVRIRPGHSATLLDVSAGGALLESHRRLLPGSLVELQMDIGHMERTVVRSRVVRSSVSQLTAAAVTYRSAVIFDRHLPWFVENSDTAIPASKRHTGRAGGATATQLVI